MGRRIQFYPDTALLQCLDSDAERLGVATSRLVTDILKRYYGHVPESSLTESELTAQVFDEVKRYIAKLNTGDTFDLLGASTSYASISMTDREKPSTVRARLGKSFAKNIGSGPFARVASNRANGKIIRGKNNAATYIMRSPVN